MSNGMKWVVGIVILAVVTLLMSLVWPYQTLKNSDEMGEAVQSALNENGMGWATVDMDGNVATLSGVAPNNAAKSQALVIAQNAQCAKCAGNPTWHEVVVSGVSVDAQQAAEADAEPVRVMPIAAPYTFTAMRAADGSVVLDGYVRNMFERNSVLAEAKALFGDNVTDNKIKLASGEPGEQWRDVIIHNLVDLAKLDQGKFVMSDDTTVLTGRARDDAARNAIMDDYSVLPAPFEGAANIQVANSTMEIKQEVTSQKICQTLFDELKSETKVTFSTGSARITGNDSFNLLNNLGSAAKQCASYRITIGGYTDSVGGELNNQQLSEARAQSVMAYMVNNQKIAPARLTAIGYGEDNPIASNDTEDGKAANRRIEFKITRSN